MDFEQFERDVDAVVSRKELAKQLEVHYTHLGRQITGKRNITLQLFKTICRIIKQKPHKYLGTTRTEKKILTHLAHMNESDKKMLLRCLNNPQLFEELSCLKIAK
jgi:hypothetical protein